MAETTQTTTHWIGDLKVDATTLYYDGEGMDTVVRISDTLFRNDTVCCVSKPQLNEFLDELNEIIGRYRI